MFHLFCVLCNYFEMGRIVLYDFDRVFYHFPLDTILGMTLKSTQEYFCYILAVLKDYIFLNLRGFYYFKVLYAANFTMINEKTTILQLNFY